MNEEEKNIDDWRRIPNFPSVLKYETMLNPFIMYIFNGAFFIFMLVVLYGVGWLIWYRQMVTFFTNKTITERYGRKRQSRLDQVGDNASTTTSLLAERAVENIGARKEVYGWSRCCQNFSNFISSTVNADCCLDDSQVGYQEQIIQELYEIAKDRHGYEDDWGLVVQKINSELNVSDNSNKNTE